jgi:hypothetical protein
MRVAITSWRPRRFGTVDQLTNPRIEPNAVRVLPRLTLALVLLFAACTKPDQSAEGTLRAFADEVRTGRYAAAYNRLSARARAELTYEDFVARLEASPEDVGAMAARLRRPNGETEITARIPIAEGEFIELIYEDGDFRVVGNVLDLYDQSTPRSALLTFVRAIENRRYDIVLRLVPAADRADLDEAKLRESMEGEQREEIARLVAVLREHLHDPIEIHGERATMPYLEAFRVSFVREDGVWKIEDPD